MHNLIPKPTSIFASTGAFIVSSNAKIILQKENAELAFIGSLLSAYLGQAGGLELEICGPNAAQGTGNFQLMLSGDTSLGEEGYELSITTDSVRLSASCPAGLFYGVQTLRQLLPPGLSSTVSLPAVSIRDVPRFAWRGAMLDVARHFFGVEDVKRYIDLISHYKMNRLHLHLSDDQG